jgi:transposase
MNEQPTSPADLVKTARFLITADFERRGREHGEVVCPNCGGSLLYYITSGSMRAECVTCKFKMGSRS